MATMIVKHKVADFNTWKLVFDQMHDSRASHGWMSHEVLQEASDPNSVIIINKAKSLEGCIAYGQSPEMKTAMQKAGVTSVPEITFFNEEENVAY